MTSADQRQVLQAFSLDYTRELHNLLATDLGRTDPDALARLIWVLNADRQGARERVALRYAELLSEAGRILAEAA